ncbi:hypothetical protein [Kingella oralis]|jgi:hypothetical protein|nr:hypothetical protein [Kingella oralis]
MPKQLRQPENARSLFSGCRKQKDHLNVERSNGLLHGACGLMLTGA